ncbi:MAG: hypothetical protein IPP51_08470 [Bacteroidetes bacterium]|nr:hypothetical protein [Bacteroidota bacterium]
MSENTSGRRKFLKYLGFTAGASLVSSKAFSAFIDTDDVKKLNPEQQEFMQRYGKWMDDFIEVIRIQKTDRLNSSNNKRMVELTELAETFKPELSKHLSDETFSLIYRASIDRMSKEI